MSTKEELMERLSTQEKNLLDSLKMFPRLDKGSQNRMRAKVDAARKANPAFEEAFGMSLGTAFKAPVVPQKQSLLGGVKDVLSHPIEAVKGQIASSALKSRNKAPKVLVYPDKKLKRIAEPIDFEKDSKESIIKIVRQLGAALRGVDYGDRLGMAAPQIGINKRIFVCQGAVCINPSFQWPKHRPMREWGEGCYSCPGKMYKTQRAEYGWATWYSIDGVKREFKLKGKDALIFQHELDHLDGLCCIDIGEEVPEKKVETPV